MAHTYLKLLSVLEGKSSELTRADAWSHILQRGWWCYKVLLKSKISLEAAEIIPLVEKVGAWVPSEDYCMELLGCKQIPISARLQIVRRVPEVMGKGNNSSVALWAMRGHVFPENTPMTSEERRILLDTFKRPSRDSHLDYYYTHGVVTEYREDRGRNKSGLTLEEVKELLPFALLYLYEHWYDAEKFLKCEELMTLVTSEQREKIEASSKNIPKVA